MELILVIGIRVLIACIALLVIIRGYIRHKKEQRQKRFDLECKKYYKQDEEM